MWDNKKRFYVLTACMKILFVCTANIFRSMSAEYLTKKCIKDNKIINIQVSSAGTVADQEPPFSYTLNRLEYYWCNANEHKQQKITNDVLKDKDFIICMAKHHQEAIKALWYESVLFNFVAYGQKKDVLDEWEYEQAYGSIKDLGKYVDEIVDYIHDAIPSLIKWLSEFEIERKFLIKKIPININKYPSERILQWFFKDENNKTIRIRKIITKNKSEYFQTIKKWHWLIRKENEVNLSKKQFDEMWENVWNRYLEKTRYIIPYEKKEIEMDVYENKLEWLVTAEVEFGTIIESKNFIVPTWFYKDITDDRNFTNANLAKK